MHPAGLSSSLVWMVRVLKVQQHSSHLHECVATAESTVPDYNLASWEGPAVR